MACPKCKNENVYWDGEYWMLATNNCHIFFCPDCEYELVEEGDGERGKVEL